MTNSRWRGRLPLVAIAGAITAMAAAGPAAGGTAAVITPAWPQLQGNAAHAGFEAAEKSVTRQNASQLTVAWTQPLASGSTQSEVTVSAGTAYVMAAGTVTAFNAVTGAQVWQAALSQDLLGTPAVQGGLVLVTYDANVLHRPSGFVVALDSGTGATVWTKKVGRMNPASLSQGTAVTTTASTAYVSLLSGQVDALQLSTGNLFWQSAVLPGTGQKGSECALSSPSVSAGLVVVDAGGEVVTALGSATGTQAWSDTLSPGNCGGNAAGWVPAISGGTVYAGWVGGLAAIDLSSGSVRWDDQSAGSISSPLSVTAGAVIAAPVPGDGTQALQAFSRSDGSVLWRSATTISEDSAATFGGLAWSLDWNYPASKAVTFDAATGHRVYSSAAFPDSSNGLPPAVDAGRVYVNTGTELICLALPGAAG